jgi:hypothetical protein
MFFAAIGNPSESALEETSDCMTQPLCISRSESLCYAPVANILLGPVFACQEMRGKELA